MPNRLNSLRIAPHWMYKTRLSRRRVAIPFSLPVITDDVLYDSVLGSPFE